MCKKINKSTRSTVEGNDNLLLMSDDSHDEKGKPRLDRVMLHSELNNASGGGW